MSVTDRDASLWSWRPLGVPPKSLKAVGKIGSQLSLAIVWRVEFLDTGSKDPDGPGYGTVVQLREEGSE